MEITRRVLPPVVYVLIDTIYRSRDIKRLIEYEDYVIFCVNVMHALPCNQCMPGAHLFMEHS